MTLAGNFTNIVPPLSNRLAVRSKTTTPVASFVSAGRPEFPEELSPAGKQIFKELCHLLEERRTLTKAMVIDYFVCPNPYSLHAGDCAC